MSAPRKEVGKSGEQREAGAFEAFEQQRVVAAAAAAAVVAAAVVVCRPSRNRFRPASLAGKSNAPVSQRHQHSEERRTRISSGASFSPPWPLASRERATREREREK